MTMEISSTSAGTLWGESWKVPGRSDDAARVAALRELQLLDSPPEQRYDDLVLLASIVCGTRTATLTLLDDTRQWYKAAIGSAFLEAPIEDSICLAAARSGDMLVVPDARRDPRFAHMPSVRSGELVFYAGMPVRSPQGPIVGTLCVRDREPRTLDEEQRRALRLLARQASVHIRQHFQSEQLKQSSARKEALLVDLQQNQGHLEEMNRSLRKLATTDELTGLWNRRGVCEHLQRLGVDRRQAGFPLSLLMIDVDHFKRINDTLTHEGGDHVLRHLGEVLRLSFRRVDVVGRYGGEEFAVVLPGIGHQAALDRAEALRARVEEDSDAITQVTISVGVATMEHAGSADELQDLLHCADRALYAAKRGGRNQVVSALHAAGVV